MANEATAPAQPAQPASAGQTSSNSTPQPAQTQTPAPSRSQAPSIQVPDDFSKAFGGPDTPFAEPVADEPQNDANATPTDEAGHVVEEGRTEEAAAADEQPSTTEGEAADKAAEPQVGDDLIKSVEELKAFGEETPAASAEADKPGAEQPSDAAQLPKGDAELMKRINPDGKRTVPEQLNNAVKLAKEAQSALGKQGNELHQHREAIKELSQFYEFKDGKAQPKAEGVIKLLTMLPAPDGKQYSPAEGVIALANSLPGEQLKEALAKFGLEVRELGASSNGDDAGEADIEAVANQLVAGDDLTPDEKISEITSSPKLNAKFQRELARREAERIVGQREKQAQQSVQTEAERRRMELDSQAWMQKVASAKDWNDVKPVFERIVKAMPADKPLSSNQYREVAYRLAQLEMVPARMKALRDQAYAKGKEDARKELDMSGLPEGEAPTYVAGGMGTSRDAAATRMAKELAGI